MSRYLDLEGFKARIDSAELMRLASDGAHNSLNGAAIDDAKIARALDYADEMIDGYLLSKNSWLRDITAQDAPDLLAGAAFDICRYRLRHASAGGKNPESDVVEKRYNNAARLLEKIRDGQIDLTHDRANGADIKPTQPSASAGSARIQGPAPRVGRILEGYR